MAKRKSAHTREIVIFIILVIITGFILAATDNFDNPVTEISDAITYGNLIQEQPVAVSGDSANGATALDTTSNAGIVTPKGVDWSQAGSVLFNIWFFCAVTAVVIVAQQVISASVRLIKHRQPSH